jgi:hypothetical protein
MTRTEPAIINQSPMLNIAATHNGEGTVLGSHSAMAREYGVQRLRSLECLSLADRRSSNYPRASRAGVPFMLPHYFLGCEVL